MSLRRKLFVTFGVLALLGMVVAGVSIWATLQWASSNEGLQNHFIRSLQVQRIRASTLEAIREVPDALSDEDPDARQEFEDALDPVEEDFEMWARLAGTEDERRQVREVRAAYDAIVGDSRTFFDLFEAGRRDEAARLADGRIEEGDFDEFEAATEAAIASDREYRDTVRAQTEDTRRTAQLVLIVAAFGSVSLLLLVAAYLASDLFRPLRDLKHALDDVKRGDLDRRLDEDRSDELGEVSRAFNSAMEAIARREQARELPPADGEQAWQSAPSRVTLHRLVSRLRSRISQLNETENGRDGYADEQGELAVQLDQLSQAVARMTDFGFPLDLNLSRTDVRALLYRVFMRFQDELAERGVSIELNIAPEVDYAVVDRLKLREAVGELLQNALSALPESGGQLGLRSRPSEDGTELLIEVADDGVGAEQSLIDDAFDLETSGPDDRPRVGLALTKAIIEQHGGRLRVESEPGGGAYAQIRLPLRD